MGCVFVQFIQAEEKKQGRAGNAYRKVYNIICRAYIQGKKTMPVLHNPISECGDEEMNNCPECGNRDHVYEHGNDPKYGDYVLCSRHGIQVCERVPTKELTV